MPNDKGSSNLFEELRTILETIKFGSLEIYVQDSVVTQITVRNIKKTKLDIKIPAVKKLR